MKHCCYLNSVACIIQLRFADCLTTAVVLVTVLGSELEPAGLVLLPCFEPLQSSLDPATAGKLLHLPLAVPAVLEFVHQLDLGLHDFHCLAERGCCLAKG